MAGITDTAFVLRSCSRRYGLNSARLIAMYFKIGWHTAVVLIALGLLMIWVVSKLGRGRGA